MKSMTDHTKNYCIRLKGLNIKVGKDIDWHIWSHNEEVIRHETAEDTLNDVAYDLNHF